jgi:capsular polysaccharide biosynthesis protein
VSCARNADVLAANHGAGLTNMLFMKPGSRVLELRYEHDNHNNCFFALANTLAVSYHYQLTKAKSDNPFPFSGNTFVNPELFEDTLMRLNSEFQEADLWGSQLWMSK